MFANGLKRKSAWLPLALIWLAAHALLLGLILSLKFLGAKALLLLAMMAAALWFAAPAFQGRHIRLPRPASSR